MRLLGTDAETGLQEQTADYEVRDGVRKGEEEGVCQPPPPTHTSLHDNQRSPVH